MTAAVIELMGGDVFCAPVRGDLQVLFMAAAPEGQKVLDFEAEEAAILEATRGAARVHVAVEESGALDGISLRLTSEEGPFEALHLSCHGEILAKRGPVLLLETLEGPATGRGAGRASLVVRSGAAAACGAVGLPHGGAGAAGRCAGRAWPQRTGLRRGR
jgi:hypothetical protein